MFEPAPAAFGGVFLSYRREDTAYSAGWLFDRLTARLGEDRVFKDVDSIELGDNFVEVIMAAVGSCDVLLALIGDRWLTVTDADGNRRLDDPDDFVRLEIEAALSRDVRVIPILVDGAAMPRPEQVPPSLAKLVRFHGLELSPSRFNADTNRLLEVLEPTLADVPAPGHPAPAGVVTGTLPPSSVAGPRPLPRPPSRGGSSASGWGMAVLGGAVALLLLLLLVVVVSNGGSDSSGSDGIASSGSITSVGSASTAAPASKPAGIIFADDFSGDDAGWKAEGDGTGGRADGRYQVRVDPIATSGGVVSSPLKATSVYPVAPEDVQIEVAAHRISSTGQETALALGCQVTDGRLYAFLIGRDDVAIVKFAPAEERFLAHESLRVDPNAVIRLQAVCRSQEDGQHLSLSVDGKPVASAVDTDPLPAGTVGLGALVGEDEHSIVAEFDDFSVTAG